LIRPLLFGDSTVKKYRLSSELQIAFERIVTFVSLLPTEISVKCVNKIVRTPVVTSGRQSCNFRLKTRASAKSNFVNFCFNLCACQVFSLIAGIKFHVQDIGQQSVKPSGLLPRKVRNITDDGSKKHAITSTS